MAIGPAEVAIGAYLVVGVAASVFVGWLTARRARSKGRRPPLWWVLGFLFGILAFAAVVLLPSARGES